MKVLPIYYYGKIGNLKKLLRANDCNGVFELFRLILYNNYLTKIITANVVAQFLAIHNQ